MLSGNPNATPTFLTSALEKIPQRFEYFLEIHDRRQTAHVVVALYDRARRTAAFYNVGIYGALHKKVHRAYFFSFLFKDPDKLLAYDFSLALGVGYA